MANYCSNCGHRLTAAEPPRIINNQYLGEKCCQPTVDVTTTTTEQSVEDLVRRIIVKSGSSLYSIYTAQQRVDKSLVWYSVPSDHTGVLLYRIGYIISWLPNTNTWYFWDRVNTSKHTREVLSFGTEVGQLKAFMQGFGLSDLVKDSN